MTNITELKEKLTKDNHDEISKAAKNYTEQGWFKIAYSSLGNTAKECKQAFHNGANFQVAQDAKTITALLSIIEDMQNGLRVYAIDDVIGTAARQTLTATEKKLKNLTEEK